MGTMAMPGCLPPPGSACFCSVRPARPASPSRCSASPGYPAVWSWIATVAYNKVPCAIQYCYSHLLRDGPRPRQGVPRRGGDDGLRQYRGPVTCPGDGATRPTDLGRRVLPAGGRAQSADHRRHGRTGAPPGHPSHPGDLPGPRRPALSLGRRPASPGREQPGRAGSAAHRHRPQSQLRLPVGCWGPHSWHPDVGAAHPQETAGATWLPTSKGCWTNSPMISIKTPSRCSSQKVPPETEGLHLWRVSPVGSYRSVPPGGPTRRESFRPPPPTPRPRSPLA